ncbi:MAG: CBS domain-containing protein [Deltaproteobacteria bacterium]|nr:CBS domain-containing protein [Deltaproteobacteria bacterium]
MAEAIPAPKKEVGPSRGRFHLLTLFGIRVTIDYTWLIIFALVLWSLSSGYFPAFFPNFDAYLYWAAGFVATVLFFASILLHELSHSVTAVRLGLEIPEITLFVFGGVAHLSQEPPDPKTELEIAIAGPLCSFALAAIFWGLKLTIQGVTPGLIVAVFDYLAWINVALAIFNLVPGYPLDGGRILKAIVWWRTGSIERGIKLTSDIGKGFAWALMILGGIQIFAGSLVGGLWLILIGMFLKGIAASGYHETVMKQSLQGVPVRDVMIEKVITVPPDASLDEVIHQYFLRYAHRGFPVVRDGKALGVLNLQQLIEIPEEERAHKTVAQVMVPISESLEIRPDVSLVEALQKMGQEGWGRLLVMDGDRMIGMITKTGLLRFLEIKGILEPPAA